MSAYPYENPVDPASVGIDPDKLARVVKRFRRQHETGAFPGGQLALRRHGKLVLNEALGVARGYRPEEAISPVQVDVRTPFLTLSAGKPLAAVAIALLEDRGALDVHAPIAEVFPGFARHGKESITTLDVLTHRSGILLPGFVAQVHLWSDREAVQRALEEAVPVYPRGTLAYAPHEFGWILNEIVLRVDGRHLADFFTEEIAVPLGLDALRFGLAGRQIDSLAFSYWLGPDKVMVSGVNVAQSYESQNSAQFLQSSNPATSLVSDASNLAAFYDFILRGGVTPSGRQLISEGTLRQYTSRQVMAWDRGLRSPVALGRGFVVGTLLPSSYGWWNTGRCFGQGGGFSCLAFGDYGKHLSAAILTNGNRGLSDLLLRFTPLAHGLRMACE